MRISNILEQPIDNQSINQSNNLYLFKHSGPLTDPTVSTTFDKMTFKMTLFYKMCIVYGFLVVL